MDKQVYTFISQQSSDPIVERRTCSVSGKEFAIFASEKKMLEKLSRTFNNETFTFPLPTICSDERQRIKLAQINQMTLYKRKCDGSGEDIVSNYAPTSSYKVYSQKYFWSDAHEGKDYGRDYDFSRPFFDQFHALDLAVPHITLFTEFMKDINSAYTNHAGLNKDCYLIFDSDENEGCMYSYGLNASKKSIDCYRSGALENCYRAIDTQKSYHCAYIRNSNNCSYCYFVQNCDNCQNCILCVNLVNKQYHYKNKPISKEEFEQLKGSLAGHKAYTAMKKIFEQAVTKFPQKATNGVNNQNVIGNFVVNSKNVTLGFDNMNCEDVLYTTQVFIGAKDVYDCEEVGGIQRAYASSNVAYNSYNVAFSFKCMSDGQNILYCKDNFYIHDCFGCISLKKQNFCILNKQYTEQEYNDLMPKIINHMQSTGERGQYYPIQTSAFPYNDTKAQERFPFTKEEAITKGFQRTDIDNKINIPEGATTIPANTLPDTAQEATDDITDKVILCEQTGRPYRILKMELEFYKAVGLPLPHLHHDIRHNEKFHSRPGRELYIRKCDKSGEEILSIYPANAPFKVYKEDVFNQEVYG